MVHVFGITVVSLIDIILILGLISALAYRQGHSLWLRKKNQIAQAAIKQYTEYDSYW